jgi:glutamine amidotransferase
VIGVVDYGAGNLASVCNALDQLGHEARSFNQADQAGEFERLILPGVGSFRNAMDALGGSGWPQALREYADAAKPLLGICLGMQLLFDEGEEHGRTPGIGLIPGRVVPMEPQAPNRVPHVGWNSMERTREHPLLRGVKPHVDFYFVHSYRCVPADSADVLARTDYGGEFVAAVAHRNVAGMQFHPEKSQPGGLRILDNFAGWDGGC